MIRNPRRTDWNSLKDSLEGKLASKRMARKHYLELEYICNSMQLIRQVDSFQKADRCPKVYSKNLETMRNNTRNVFNRAQRYGNWENYRKNLPPILRAEKSETKQLPRPL